MSEHSSTWRVPVLRAVGWLLVVLVLAVVFGWYLEPDFMLTLADQAWACF